MMTGRRATRLDCPEMRRGLAVVGACAVVLLMAACGSRSQSSQTSSTGTSQTSSGSSRTKSTASMQSAVTSQQDKAALKAVRANPDNPAAWSLMIQALWAAAGTGSYYNTATATFTASGKQLLSQATQAWQHYLQLTKNPDPNLAVLAARAYAALGNYAGAASAWEVETVARPGQSRGYECLAVAAYAAKQTRKGDLALAKALTLVPKAERITLKTQIQQAKTQPTIAQRC